MKGRLQPIQWWEIRHGAWAAVSNCLPGHALKSHRQTMSVHANESFPLPGHVPRSLRGGLSMSSEEAEFSQLAILPKCPIVNSESCAVGLKRRKDAMRMMSSLARRMQWQPPAVTKEVLKRGSKLPEADCERIFMNPHKVMFIKPSIKSRFSCGRLVSQTIEDLRSGHVSVEDMPLITVIERHGKYLSVDHRRLYAFRAAFPKDVEVPMLLARTECRLMRYVPQDCKGYSSVRVESQDGERVSPRRSSSRTTKIEKAKSKYHATSIEDPTSHEENFGLPGNTSNVMQ